MLVVLHNIAIILYAQTLLRLFYVHGHKSKCTLLKLIIKQYHHMFGSYCMSIEQLKANCWQWDGGES